MDGDSLLVGARNIVYNISLRSLDENQRLEWSSTDEDIRICKLKGKSVEVCQNYVRILAKKSSDVLLVCGTNAFKPRCREYTFNGNGDYRMVNELPGEAKCPYDPYHNSTAVYVEDNLYAATVAQFSGGDPLIYRPPLRTEQLNLKQLNAPNFVNSMHHEDHVYFFLRETAVEYMNCGKTVYSRVARVCTKDKGGPHKFRNHWTSFVKARLNCSIGGDIPFYFNEIQSTSSIVKGVYNGRNNELLYGVFTTPANSMGASAVCAFRMEDVQRAFDGQFKGQEDSNSNWLPIQNAKVPEPRPGQCVNDSRHLPDNTLNFLKDHMLMDQAVSSLWGGPILVQTSFQFRFTQIAVDPQIETVSGKTFDVLFIGTDDGRVIKAINAAASAPGGHHYHNKVVPVINEEIQVFPKGTPVTNLLVHHTLYEAKLLVVSSNEIQAIPLHKCQQRGKTCGQCVGLQDPYCAWDINRQLCTSSRSRYWNRDSFVQNIEDGWDPRCPDGRPPSSANPDKSPPHTEQRTFDGLNPQSGTNVVNENDGPSSKGDVNHNLASTQLYTAETLAFAVVTSVVTSLVVGFILGYIFSKRCRKEDPNACNPYADPSVYLEHHHHHHPDVYSGATNKPINLVLNVPPKNGKNANSSADNKPIAKVKKIYL
ncbi:Semaphorin-1A [Halotydeus destructor]|nr:Semaphorin-1A [Halotydeus destructor]